MLDKQSEKVLKFIRKNGKVTLEQLKNNFNGTPDIHSCISFLLKLNFIEGTTVPYYGSTSSIIRDVKLCSYVRGPYNVTAEGMAYIENLYSDYKKSIIKTTITVGLTAFLTNIDRITEFVIGAIEILSTR